jgi:hypothetical protein
MFLKTHLVIHLHLLHKTYILSHVLQFKLSTNPSQKIGLHIEILHKWNTLVELWIGDYVTSYGLVNDVDETFQDYIRISLKSLIWIKFFKICVEYNTKLENSDIYEMFLILYKNWTPIEKQ